MVRFLPLPLSLLHHVSLSLSLSHHTSVPVVCLPAIICFVGKIAASSGHAAWVSGELSRARVFRTRAQSDAVIVGGNTVRRDSMLS
jgi:riboflavin biosynthesis pyrimidine reductase